MFDLTAKQLDELQVAKDNVRDVQEALRKLGRETHKSDPNVAERVADALADISSVYSIIVELLD